MARNLRLQRQPIGVSYAFTGIASILKAQIAVRERWLVRSSLRVIGLQRPVAFLYLAFTGRLVAADKMPLNIISDKVEGTPQSWLNCRIFVGACTNETIVEKEVTSYTRKQDAVKSQPVA